VVFDADGELVANIGIGHFQFPRLFATPWVHPDYIQLGLYAELIAIAEERARELIPEAPEGARVTLNSNSYDGSLDLTAAIQQAGFSYIRSDLRMEIDMTEPPPAPVWPEGIELRPFDWDTQARQVHAADEEAFADHWGQVPMGFEVFESWFLKENPNFDRMLWFIPWAGDEVVGTFVGEHRGQLGWCGGLSVRRPWRRSGIALALLHHAFAEFYRRGTSKVGLEVDAQSLTGATRLYEKAGMHLVYRENQYQKILRDGVELSTQELVE
jgi:GNAT superfamily N-acetyltransferase